MEEIVEKATIYRKEGVRPLTNYQKSLNNAAQTLSLKDPGLLSKRQMLIEMAREKIIGEDFQFVKGKSRSKKLTSGEPKAKLSKDV